MKIEKVIKVKFLKPGDLISTNGEEIVGNTILLGVETNVEFNQLLDIISEIELKRDGLGKSLHKEAFTGVDYLGNKVTFCSYVVWQDDGKIYKYNFNEDWVPFNNELTLRNRENKINDLLD